MSDLKDFQQRTVEYVSRRMLDEGARRFLVADEVGLGKTLVARGVVARTVEQLQAEGVRRIDVVYVCSNQEIAKQNLVRLRLPGYSQGARLSRIGLLPLQLDDFAQDGVNFLSLTPGTSLDAKSRAGWARERAVLFRMLEEPWGLRPTKGVLEVLRVDAARTTLQSELAYMGKIHEGLRVEFARVIGSSSLQEQFMDLIDVAARRQLNDEERQQRLDVIGALRHELSRVCIDALQPDLVVLDEFQRFGHLLDGGSDEAVLARQLFNFDNGRGEFARVLLLSATPYKSFSHAGESGVSHQAELSRLLRFLFEDDARAATVEHEFRELRERLLVPAPDGAALVSAREALEASLASVMVRTERLACSATRNGMLEERRAPEFALEVADVVDGVRLGELHALLRDRGLLKSPAAVTEYWKSAPWLAQFMDHYQFKTAITQALGHRHASDAELSAALDAVREQLDWVAFRAYEDLAPANARMRSLRADTVDAAWDLLWIPSSLPYYLPGAPFDKPEAAHLTKRLVFSSWDVVPRSIAGYLSYEAERRAQRAAEPMALNTPESRRAHERRLLDFKIDRADGYDRPGSMTALAWLFPCLTLGELGDPRAAAAGLVEAGLPSLESVLDRVHRRVRAQLRDVRVETDFSRPAPDLRWYWAAPLLFDAQRPDGQAFWNVPGLASEWSGPQPGGGENWQRHLAEARGVLAGEIALGRQPDDLADVLAVLAVAGPGVAALRSVQRVMPSATPLQAQLAAARIAWGFRQLFNGPEAIAIVTATGDSGPYWRQSLRYALNGNLQAVLDEWMHVLGEDAGAGREPVRQVLDAMTERVSMVLGLGASRVDVDRVDASDHVAWRTHFAVRYGQFKQDGSRETVHPEAVRRAFNSPMRPFVLASTSVGQEGLDFHTYCHAIVHWNLPSNPVDLEQREGRVHRYKGHAVRRNVAEGFSEAAIRSAVADPWAAAFDAATDAREEDQDDLVPFWLQRGSSAIERYVPALPYSKDAERFARVKRQVTLYRMVFGQPRQDDLVAYLQEHVGQEEAEHLAELVRIDLSPPLERVSTD